MRKIRKNITKTGYPGVYRNGKAKTYYYSTYVNENPFITKRHYSCGYKTAIEAFEAKQEYEKKTRHVFVYQTKKNRVGYLIQKYLDHKKQVVKLSSYHSIELLINKYIFDPYLKLTVEEFATESVLDNFRDKLKKKKMLTIHKNRILREVREIYKYGVLINIISPDLLSMIIAKTEKFAVTLVEKKKNNTDNFWSIEQWKHFISVIDKKSKWYIFFVIYGQLGCRIGEIRGLQIKHVINKGTAIRIEQQAQNKCGIGETLITTPKTKSSIRDVSISPASAELLKAYMRTYECKNQSNFLFFNTEAPTGVQSIRRAFDEYTKKAKLPRITLHGIRHSNCTWLLANNKMTPQEIGQVSKRLGHASTKMTLDIYMGIHKEEAPLIKNTLDEIY